MHVVVAPWKSLSHAQFVPAVAVAHGQPPSSAEEGSSIRAVVTLEVTVGVFSRGGSTAVQPSRLLPVG
jgi:hypothetical protein